MSVSGILQLRLAAMSLLVAALAAIEDMRPADGRMGRGDTPRVLRACTEDAKRGDGTHGERPACGAFAEVIGHRGADEPRGSRYAGILPK
ncbi:hypothetical protein [Methylobacterium iners]|uniref:Secreted protein n=1 Tax=Methylobacterium iners TaxID=418707 RepID=A0ABQ4RUG3_9HYPH|nr:hypothetical protein [Methylobacterium iners]GJD94411.1 hypothetical protein OCOJLMKI_1613 [Methylobacterium iners]